MKASKLGELCSISTGKSDTKDAVEDGIYPFYDRSKIVKRSNDFFLDKEALIMPGEGAIFLPKLYKGKFNLHQRAYALYDFDKCIDIKFIFYYLNHVKDYFPRVAVGATVKSLRLRHFQDLKIFFPTLPEQKRIVAKLDKAFAEIDKAIEINSKTELNIEILSKSIFKNNFHSKSKLMKLSSLGEVKSGGTPRSTEKKYWNGEIDWYSSGELNKMYALPALKKITRDGLKNSNAKIFPKNSLLIGMYDTAAMKMSILKNEATFNQAIAAIPPNEHASPQYLFYLLNYLKPKILLERRGIRQQNLSLSKIKNIDIPIPSMEEQRYIVELLDKLTSKINLLLVTLSKKNQLLMFLKSAILKKELQSEAA